jgi:hypothetical protein
MGMLVVIAFPPASADLLPHLPFDPEDGGDIFRRNFQLSPDYTALQHGRQHCSASYIGGAAAGMPATLRDFVTA